MSLAKEGDVDEASRGSRGHGDVDVGYCCGSACLVGLDLDLDAPRLLQL